MNTPLRVADVLTPDALRMLASIAESGSMAAAARTLGLVPSAAQLPRSNAARVAGRYAGN